MALTDKLTAIADAIRSKTGTTEPMTLDEMVTAIANDNYTIGTSSVPCYLSQLPVNFNEFNSWTESTEYDTSNAKFTTLGTLILSNEIIETWSSTNTNTHNIYFNKNFEI